MKSSFKHIILAAIAFLIVMGHRGDIPQFAKNYVLKRDTRFKYRGAQR